MWSINKRRNKTKYFRLRLPERDLRMTWDRPEPKWWRLRALDKLEPDGRTYEDCDSLSSWRSQKNTSRSRTQPLLAWNYPVSVSFRASHLNTTLDWSVQCSIAASFESKRNNWHYATDFTVMWCHYQDLAMRRCVQLWERADHMNRSWESNRSVCRTII